MNTVNIMSEGDSSTVICHKSQIKPHRFKVGPKESDLEESLVSSLRCLGYERLKISNEEELKNNARRQLQRLNSYKFSDSDWERFCNDYLTPKNVYEGTKTIQENSTIDFRDSSGALHNIKLVDKSNLSNNFCQAIEQFRDREGKNRYDVTILINGLPLVQVELKKPGVDLREAYNQTNRYKKESFRGLYNFIQLFVISNGCYTRYYSSTVKNRESKEKQFGKSYKFTSRWTDQNNEHIDDLESFTETFFAKPALLSVITRYCVFTAGENNEDRELLVMRPYQITATEKILSKIKSALCNGGFVSGAKGGYIWHTTGSGKTLTSFKAAILASQMRDLYKVVFVVDRQDLDYQTIKEYNRYKEGSVDYNGNTRTLKAHLLDPDADRKVVVTTIQKLSNLLTDKWKSDLDAIRNKNFVFIFDECHRTQAGKMHARISSNFKSSILFGFTGTPIFDSSKEASIKGEICQATTEALFGDRLHAYTIKDAIGDKNVLPFSYSYFSDPSKKAIPYNSPVRVRKIVEHVLKDFKNKTHNFEFNSLFAADSIRSAREYYEEFKRQQESIRLKDKLKIALVYSIAANKEGESDDGGASENDREFLRRIVKEDYNKIFGENRDLNSSDGGGEYYKDVSKKMKEKNLDIAIVVNMFLTGFDAKRLNTLWIDKDMESHNLIQAFSRTNRIFDTVKDHGVIVSFRDLEEKMNEALRLYGDDANSVRNIVILRSYEEQLQGWRDKDGEHIGYLTKLERFRNTYAPGQTPEGENAKERYVREWNEILKDRNILEEEERFKDDDPLSPEDFQAYSSAYLDIRDDFEKTSQDGQMPKEIVFEMELLSQEEVNVDYILKLIGEGASNERLESLLTANPKLRNKTPLFIEFSRRWRDEKASADQDKTGMEEAFWEFYRQKREEELNEIISKNGLKEVETKKLMKKAFEEGTLFRTGRDFDDILPPRDLFDPKTAEKNDKVYRELKNYVDKFDLA